MHKCPSKLDHPSCHQLKTVIHRYLYALALDRSIEKATTGCHQCASLLKVLNVIQEQSTSDPPEKIEFNKNPIAERAIQELEDEILRQGPTCRAVMSLTLSLAVARMNTRIRYRGISSREMWTQLDQFTNSQLPFNDQKLTIQQHDQKVANHSLSEKSKTPSGKISDVAVGD